FHRGYETVAIEFGLTEENCPDRGRASLPFDKLVAAFENETMMFGYFSDDIIVGFLGIKLHEGGICKLDDIVILPEYRQLGYGKKLLDFCKVTAKELGASKILLAMIDDNKRLRKWYEENGFINIGYKKYDGAPFTVGRMECIL
ncbi:MAG: GNAT family N-acetyltransferase, partial [Eubacteriales bacterium]|nr:GNAT family N-acetyltransferase [Eubacteriales bacterium]